MEAEWISKSQRADEQETTCKDFMLNPEDFTTRRGGKMDFQKSEGRRTGNNLMRFNVKSGGFYHSPWRQNGFPKVRGQTNRKQPDEI